MNTGYTIHSIRPRSERVSGMRITEIDVRDKYHAPRYRVGRWLVHAYTGTLQRYLAGRPTMEFEHRRNVARQLSYIPGGMKAWAGYMPGGFATYYVHEPDHRRMVNGKKLDFITRNFFRHSYDSIGVRARLYILSWLVAEWVDEFSGDISWVSIGCGSGQPVYDVVRSLPSFVRAKATMLLVDQDEIVIEFAKKLYDHQRKELPDVTFMTGNIVEPDFMQRVIAGKVSIVDMMGLFEYLKDDDCATVLSYIYSHLEIGGLIIFTNMSDERPHLDVHTRAIGWPGVIMRSVESVAAIIDAANIPAEALSAYTSRDRVYNVYRIMKL